MGWTVDGKTSVLGLPVTSQLEPSPPRFNPCVIYRLRLLYLPIAGLQPNSRHHCRPFCLLLTVQYTFSIPASIPEGTYMDDSPASLDSRRAILQRWLDEDLDETSQLFKRLEYLTDLTKKRPWQTCINEISKITYERSSVEDRNTLGISYNASGWIMSHPLLQTQIDAWSHLKELPPAEAENKPMVEWLWPFFSCTFHE